MKISDFIKQSSGKFITVCFVKKDGSTRIMNCRIGVKKYLRGGESKLNPNKFITVFDLQKMQYRCINIDTINYVKSQGLTIAKAS